MADGTTETTTTTTAPAGGGNGAPGNAAPADSKTTTSTTAAPEPKKGADTLLGAPDDKKPDPKTTTTAPQPTKVELKLPEGFDAKHPLLGKFTEAAQVKGLNTEQAQAIFDVYASHQAELAKQAETADQQLVKGWLEQAEKDPELGLSGAKRDETIALYRRAVTELGGPELQQVLHQTGLANHPAVIRAFVKAGRERAEDSVRGGLKPGGPKDEPNRVYRELFPKSPELFGDQH